MKIKNLKLNKEKLKLCTSCILIATTTAITMKATKLGLPFYVDNIKQNTYNASIINSNGEKVNYITTDNKENILIYYNNWESNNNNNFRKYQIYSLNTNDTYFINNNYITNKEFINNLGSPIKEGIEYKELISEKEKNEYNYWEAYIYTNNINNYITYKENNTDNVISTIGYLLITSSLCYIPYNNYQFEKTINKKLIFNKKK